MIIYVHRLSEIWLNKQNVLTESEKFNSHGVVPLQLKERIDTIITDDHIPEDIKTHLLSENKTLLTIENE